MSCDSNIFFYIGETKDLRYQLIETEGEVFTVTLVDCAIYRADKTLVSSGTPTVKDGGTIKQVLEFPFTPVDLGQHYVVWTVTLSTGKVQKFESSCYVRPIP